MMKSIQPALIIMLLATGTSHALAQERATENSSGNLQFQGAVMETSCTTDMQQNRVMTSCFREGKNQMISAPVSALQHLPPAIGSSELRWLDSTHQRAILTQNYN
ncbi:hypothetical protein Q3V30_07015 [Erwinia pyri]|uniref:Type 1 fimbrial protein n=1 Tax=Erwinia pyri TaxID=3062598 RepID=A0AA50DLN3_9GAMM|nr:hypothetical protein [Erwinia sp. DE2]WLS80224.1 hypothetical protein Q3V30_07015 [Erwinia sp. DE2]